MTSVPLPNWRSLKALLPSGSLSRLRYVHVPTKGLFIDWSFPRSPTARDWSLEECRKDGFPYPPPTLPSMTRERRCRPGEILLFIAASSSPDYTAVMRTGRAVFVLLLTAG